MQALNHFSLPLKGLKNGKHNYTFQVDEDFFESFDNAPVASGSLIVTAELNKQSNHLELLFHHKGTVRTECDRCTAEIDLPVEGTNELIVKFSEEENEEEAVVFIHPESHAFNLAKYIYEFVVLSIPMMKVYDCKSEKDQPCNTEVLRVLEESQLGKIDHSIWDSLKNVNINN